MIESLFDRKLPDPVKKNWSIYVYVCKGGGFSKRLSPFLQHQSMLISAYADHSFPSP